MSLPKLSEHGDPLSLIAAKNVVTPALLHELRPLLHVNTKDVEGRTLAERLDEPTGWVDREVMRALNDPVSPVGGPVTLEGNLACGSAPNHTQSHTSGRTPFEGQANARRIFQDNRQIPKASEDRRWSSTHLSQDILGRTPIDKKILWAARYLWQVVSLTQRPLPATF